MLQEGKCEGFFGVGRWAYWTNLRRTTFRSAGTEVVPRRVELNAKGSAAVHVARELGCSM